MPRSAKLQDQIKQPTPFRSLEAEAFLNVLRTSTVLVGTLVEVLRPFALTQPQYNVLRILRGAGPAGLPSGEVATRMVSREPDITRLLDRMEARRLVVRERSPDDRRVVVARLTDAGRQVTDDLDAPVQALHARQLGHLSHEKLETFIALLTEARNERPPRAAGRLAVAASRTGDS